MDDDSQMAYDQWHAGMAGREDDDASPWHQMAKRQLGDIHHLKVLEIGCGRGGFSSYLAKQGANLIAADFSAEAVRAAGRLLTGLPNVETMVADIERIPFPAASFDLTVSMETLEHIPDPAQGLAELVRVTKSKGRLIVSTPNYLSMEGLYRLYVKATGRTYRECGQPINQPLTLAGQYHQFRKLGCRVLCVDGRGFYLPIPNRRPQQFHPPLPHFIGKWLALHTLIVAEKP